MGKQKNTLNPKKCYSRWHWYDETYHINWYYSSGSDAQLCLDHILKVLGIKEEYRVRNPNAMGTCYAFDGKRDGYIWTRDHTPPASVIVHETFHAMTGLADNQDSAITTKNEEFYSYYQARMFTEIMKCIEKGQKILELRRP